LFRFIFISIHDSFPLAPQQTDIGTYIGKKPLEGRARVYYLTLLESFVLGVNVKRDKSQNKEFMFFIILVIVAGNLK
jgi:hypothetical protein